MDNQKTAVITGIRGQDASYLAELLLDKGYKVVGISRRTSNPDFSNVSNIIDHDNFEMVSGDVADGASISSIVLEYKPDEFYNLAAQSFVAASWSEPVATFQTNALGVINCLEAIRQFSPETRFYQASTSERFGKVLEMPQTEKTPTNPMSPYAASKCAGEDLVKVYRESYGLYACYGMLFNHESERRGVEFVTRKITHYIGSLYQTVKNNETKILSSANAGFLSFKDLAAKALELGIVDQLALGNLEARRDWTHASDMVEGMWLMLNQEEPKDYVLSSGTTRSIREFLDYAFADINLKWESFVRVDPKFYRPAEVEVLLGDCTKAQEELGWEHKTPFREMVRRMVTSDCGENPEPYIKQMNTLADVQANEEKVW